MTTLTTNTQIANLAIGMCGVTDFLTTLGSDGGALDNAANLYFAPTRDELLEMYPWQEYVQHRPLVLTTGYYEFNQEFDYDPFVITNITQANPAVVTTSAAHSGITGDLFKIYDVVGMTEVNRTDPYHITLTDATNFQLTGIDSTNWTAYTSGGECYKLEALAKYQDGFVYDLPSDFAYAIDLESREDFELKGIAGDVKLLTIADDAVLKYIRSDFSDVSKWTSLFINALVARLAIKLAPGILGVQEARQYIPTVLVPAFQEAYWDATFMTATNRRQTLDRTDTWISDRGGV